MLRNHLPIPTALAILAALIVTAGPADAAHQYRAGSAEPNSLRLSIGLFEPRGDSDYWLDKQRDFTGGPEDFEDGAGAIDYVRELSPRLSLLVGGAFYEGESRQSYIDFVDESGRPIRHRTTLETSALNVGLIAHLAGPNASFRPYIGAGGGFYSYRLTEAGDFIDFTTADPFIFDDHFMDQGSTFGHYWQAGVEFPIGSDWTIFADGRWQRAREDLGEDFEGLGQLDLGGRVISGGIAFRF